MASGAVPESDCLDTFQQLKLGKKLKYIIFTLKNEASIIVEKTSESREYDDFLSNLPENECRWAVYDFQFEKDGAQRNKIVFYSWSPDSAKTRQKMVFASSKDALKRNFVGIAVEIQGTELDEVRYEVVLDKAKRTGH